MSEIKCAKCGSTFTSGPATCPNCGVAVGAKPRVGLLVFGAVAVVAFLFWRDSSTPQTTAISAPTNRASVPATPAPVEQDELEILAANGSQEYGYHTVEGQVRNLSGRRLENIEAVATWYTESGEFVKSSDALVEYNPIMPGQTSPFKVMTSANPAIKRFSVEFKELMGKSIKTKDSRRTK